MRLFSCPFHAFCKPFFSIKKKKALVALFSRKNKGFAKAFHFHLGH
jgi:hypothetical protein